MFTSYSSDPLFYYFVVVFLLLFVLLVSLITSIVMQLRRNKEHIVHTQAVLDMEAELANAKKNVKDVERRNVYLERENLRLNPFAVMPDAFAEVKQQRDKAQVILQKSTQRANIILNQAKTNADEIIAKSRRQLVEKSEVADLALRQARERADSILTDADLRAEQVAGDAWDAKDRLAFYQRTALAMKNKVGGYSDDYLIPSETLLEDLSEQYSHEHAGRRLTRVRERITLMIRDRKAADCDCENKLRKERSIKLVLDAFNGKAETILTKVSTENIGKLQAELEDAFELVNFNGTSFQNARILPEYADLYQAQLKYAGQVHELKRRDKEEQSRIKADMCDQRQAQKESKKTKQQALKKPKRILKAIKRTEAKLKNSTDAQKHEYQAQLAELMDKLRNAEAQIRTEQSIAPPTKKGHVYVVSNIGSFGENVLKIGMTCRLEPLNKVKELGDKSVPFGFDVHAIIYSDDAPELERYLHSKFQSKRVNKINSKKDFYDIALGEVRAEIDSLNLHCQWTMKAEATEYRESVQLRKNAGKEDVHYAEILEIG